MSLQKVINQKNSQVFFLPDGGTLISNGLNAVSNVWYPDSINPGLMPVPYKMVPPSYPEWIWDHFFNDIFRIKYFREYPRYCHSGKDHSHF
jgi:hypothetical protein